MKANKKVKSLTTFKEKNDPPNQNPDFPSLKNLYETQKHCHRSRNEANSSRYHRKHQHTIQS